MEYMFGVTIFILGAVLGSFFNVCIYRLPQGFSIVSPRSFCPQCNQQIKDYDLIPILSYLLLKGRCRYCKTKIGFQYPLVEIITGFLTVLLYIKFGFTYFFLKYLILAYLLIVISGIDIKHRRILNIITLPGIILALLGSIFNGWNGLFDSVLGLVVGGGILFPIAFFFPQGMGMGDVKMLAMIGAFIGPKIVFFALFIGAALGSIIGLSLILSKIISRKTPIPFGPFLAVGALVSLLLF